ncbi:12723_t:CDS:2 [Funneliformis mosseae]|uniref:12723_t:CDS:1 n=1 Tax=Funneliformis mosseae TaxID=27381 RepID=A0A9N9GLY6_FUNMO|nr:12723_t:CDS:2 [Funneliformis mosseae]
MYAFLKRANLKPKPLVHFDTLNLSFQSTSNGESLYYIGRLDFIAQNCYGVICHPKCLRQTDSVGSHKTLTHDEKRTEVFFDTPTGDNFLRYNFLTYEFGKDFNFI